MKKFVSIIVILFLSLQPWSVSPDSALALHNLIFWPAFLGSILLGLVILGWSIYEEARA